MAGGLTDLLIDRSGQGLKGRGRKQGKTYNFTCTQTPQLHLVCLNSDVNEAFRNKGSKDLGGEKRLV